MLNSKKLWAAVTTTMIAGSTLLPADQVVIGPDVYHRYEWRASTFSMSQQAQPVIDVDAQGNIIAVWSSRRQQEGAYGVYAQRFTPQGIALGTETTINLWTDSHQWTPDISGGRADTPTWIAWTSHNQDGQFGSIMARRYDDSFNGSSEILVNQQWQGDQSSPIIATSPSGISTILWTCRTTSDTPIQLHARMLGMDGQMLSDEFTLVADPICTAHMPSIAWLNEDTFAVVYAVNDEHNVPHGIRMQRFSTLGQPLGDTISVSNDLKTSQIEPYIAALPDGCIVAWLDAETDGDSYGVVARRFDTEGCPLDEEPFLVNTTTRGSQNGIAIAVDDSGRFVIAYNSLDADGLGIFGKMFAANGAPIGREFRINQHVEKKQSLQQAVGTSRLVFNENGDLICVWSGDGGYGDSSAVQVTMLSPKLYQANAPLGVTGDMPPALMGETEFLATAKPHEPPTFDPKAVAEGEREIIQKGRGLGFTGFISTGWTPPDPHMAVGPDHIVAIVNGGIAFFTKDGTLTFQDQIEGSQGFWGALGTSGFVFDPEAVYDELSGRFWAMATEGYAPGNRSYILIAVSDDADPNGNWNKYRLDTTSLAGDLYDSPNISVDDQAVYITGDAWASGANYPVFIYDKASFLAGNPPAITNSFNLPTSTQSAGIPPVVFDNPPALYLVEHQEGSNRTSVRLIAITDPLGTPSYVTTNLTVPAYSAPGDPPQMGTSSRPETFDARFWSVAYRNGSLWATHHINSSPVKVRWYEIAMNGWPTSGSPSLVQSGDINHGSSIHTFFCSITADEQNNAALTYARSSSSEYISMRAAYRMSTDAPGTFRPEITMATSTAAYTAGRWGDYSAVQRDPGNCQRFWAHHEYALGSQWRTWIGSIDLPYRAADVNCSGIVNIDDIFTVLGDWGSCYFCAADVNGDGLVNIDDIFAILGDWG